MNSKRMFHIYLFLLLFSLVGNAAAEFAFLWLGASLLNDSGTGVNLISSFYIGQGIGYVFFAPYLSSRLSPFSNRARAVLVDSVYILIYCLILLLFKFELLNYVVLFFLSIATASLSSVHRNGVTFALLNKLSEEIDIDILIKKYSLVFNFILLSGAAVSGFLFGHFGFVGCIYLAIISFVPMLVIYFFIFGQEGREKDLSEVPSKKKSIIGEISTGFRTLSSNKNLMFSAIGTSLAYIPGAIYPGLLAFYGASQEVAEKNVALGVSAGILVGTIFIPIISKLGTRFQYNIMLSLAFIPALVSLIFAIYIDNFYFFCLTFALNCVGFSILNVLTVMVRVKSVNKAEISTLNTAYYATMCIGQIVGTLVLLPVIKANPSIAMSVMILSFGLASLVFYRNCEARSTMEIVAKVDL